MTVDKALAWAELPKDEQALESLRHGDEIGWIELSDEALQALAAEVRRLRRLVESAFREAAQGRENYDVALAWEMSNTKDLLDDRGNTGRTG